MMVSLQGQTALVTGSSSGIGEGIARAMAAAGAKVVVNYAHSEDAATRVVQDIRAAGGTAMAVGADVSREDQVKHLVGAACQEYGTLDILVSNAGIQSDARFVDMTLEQWQKVIGINLTGAFLCAREAVQEFLRRGVVQERSAAAGKIIFISSVHQVIPWAGHANYAAAKGGIEMLMKTLAQELAPARVRVNAIAPGAIKTKINKSAWDTPEAAASLLKLIPYGRIGEPKDIGPVAVWLASDEADYLTGTTLYVDGGMLLYPGFRTGG
jgi:glucose 1-dehydrogenase